MKTSSMTRWRWFAVALIMTAAAAPAVSKPAKKKERLCYLLGDGELRTTLFPMFKRFGRETRRQTHMRLSGAAPALKQLAETPDTIAVLSRDITDAERTAFKQAAGAEPAVLRLAADRVAVYVHPSNPLAGKTLSLSRLRALYGAAPGNPRTWGELGLQGEWATKPVTCYGLQPAHPNHAYVNKTVLGGNGFAADVRTELTNDRVVDAVAGDPSAIGYASLNRRNDGVAVLAVAPADGADGVAPGDPAYPLQRSIWLVVNKTPGKPLADMPRKTLPLLYASATREALANIGYRVVSDEEAARELAKVDLAP